MTGFDMPVFPKRRFQHGAVPAAALRRSSRPRRARLPARLRRVLRRHAASLTSRLQVPYPDIPAARERFILEHRGPRPAHDPWRHQGVLVEDERGERRPRRHQRDDLPDRARVSVAVRDVRPVAAHRWTTRPPARFRRRSTPPAPTSWRGATPSCRSSSTTPAASSIRGRCHPATTRRSPTPCARSNTSIVESHPSLDRSAARTIPRRAVAATRSGPPPLEDRDGSRNRAPRGAGATEQAHDCRRLQARGRRHSCTRGVALRAFVLIAPPFVAREEQLRLAGALRHHARSRAVRRWSR